MVPQGRVYPGQAQPQTYRTQRSYARVDQERASTGDDKCYEAMLACCGFTCGTLGSIPLLCCFPKFFKLN